MSDNALAVTVRTLAPLRVAYLRYSPGDEAGDPGPHIRARFQRVQAWLRERGRDPLTMNTIGAIRLVDGRLAGYDCCVEAPDDVPDGADDIGIQTLPGGRYAVLHIAKDPAVIGEAIGRFHRDFLPHSDLEIDGGRPTCEIYFEHTMEYCVPVM